MPKPDLSTVASIQALPDRRSPYWNILEYCRHIGIEKSPGRPIYWLARIRRKDRGYTQQRLAIALGATGWVIDRDTAVQLANAWFETPEIKHRASRSFPVGVTNSLKYDKAVTCFTVGDALRDYVEWKRLAAARSHFDTILSLINFHIIPRLGDVEANTVTARLVTEFCRDILETPPKRGNQPLGPRVALESLDPEALRKRKKTANALVAILRGALRMAWENGEIENDRTWRCIHRLPSRDAPRHIFLNRTECRLLLEHCRADLGTIVRGALYSGCRVSELERMRVGDVGAGVLGIYIGPSKNGRSRYVVLSSEGMSFFSDLARERPDDAYLFRMQSGRRWRGNHKHLFKEAVRDAGLPSSFVFHGLRHTYASQLVQAGTPLAVVAAQLGHSNTDTVSRTYGHLSISSIEMHIERDFAPLGYGIEADKISK